jgi:hypothetical protein
MQTWMQPREGTPCKKYARLADAYKTVIPQFKCFATRGMCSGLVSLPGTCSDDDAPLMELATPNSGDRVVDSVVLTV